METEFNLSEWILPNGTIRDVDVKEFIKKEGELLKEFEDLMLQPNTKSKNFIEISDFLFYLNNFLYKRKLLAGDKCLEMIRKWQNKNLK